MHKNVTKRHRRCVTDSPPRGDAVQEIHSDRAMVISRYQKSGVMVPNAPKDPHADACSHRHVSVEIKRRSVVCVVHA